MKDLTLLLQEDEYHIDPLGRLVIEKPELLDAIHGAVGATNSSGMFSNVGCSNSGC